LTQPRLTRLVWSATYRSDSVRLNIFLTYSLDPYSLTPYGTCNVPSAFSRISLDGCVVYDEPFEDTCTPSYSHDRPGRFGPCSPAPNTTNAFWPPHPSAFRPDHGISAPAQGIITADGVYWRFFAPHPALSCASPFATCNRLSVASLSVGHRCPHPKLRRSLPLSA